MKRSDIGWTDYSGGDANFVIGCTKTSAGCKNCYGFAWAKNYGRDFAQVTLYPDKLKALGRAKFDAGDPPYRRGPGARPMCFVVDLGDLFHDDVPEAYIAQALDVLASRQDVDWQILTKRAARMATILGPRGPLAPNIWVGVTVEDQKAADERLPLLAQVQAAVRFVSCEPLLGPVHLDLSGVGWVICGGESGGDRRPFDKAWAADLWGQCEGAGVPYFFKQGGGRYPGQDDLLGGECIKQWPQGGGDPEQG